MQDIYDWLIGRVGVSQLSLFDKQRIEALTAKFGLPALNKRCPNCYQDAIVILLSRLRKMKKKQRYTMSRGVAFRYKGTIYTAGNITDEAAKWWLKQNAANAKYITELPDWTEGSVAEAPIDDTKTKQTYE